MNPGQLIGALIGGYMLVLSSLAALAAVRALHEEDREQLAMRVFWSITKTTMFLGLPTLIGLLVLLGSDSKGDGGGIMSKQMGLGLMFFAGVLGLIMVWVSNITLGFIGALAVRKLSPLAAGAVMFGILSFAPVLIAAELAMGAQQAEKRRRGR